jgi:hypothetical protein
VKLVLFDDAALGMVANWHELFFGRRNLTSDRRRGRAVRPTDVARVTNVLGDGLKRAHSTDDLAAALCAATSTLAQDEWPFLRPRPHPTASRPSASTARRSSPQPSSACSLRPGPTCCT